MKIAVACENGSIGEHFGHCKQYLVAQCQGTEIVEANYLDAPEHQPGVLPKFLADQGVDIVIVGGIGSKAVTLFNHNKIDVYSGCSGDCLTNVTNFLTGRLVSTGAQCAGHDHDENHQCTH